MLVKIRLNDSPVEIPLFCEFLFPKQPEFRRSKAYLSVRFLYAFCKLTVSEDRES